MANTVNALVNQNDSYETTSDDEIPDESMAVAVGKN